MTRSRLPIGIRSFREIRERHGYYVDKTAHLARLADEDRNYVLSRPPGFGKSLLLDTLGELFAGGEPLCAGLAVHDEWDWSVRHPVARLSFGGAAFRHEGDLRRVVADQWGAMEADAGVAAGPASAPGRWHHVIAAGPDRQQRPAPRSRRRRDACGASDACLAATRRLRLRGPRGRRPGRRLRRHGGVAGCAAGGRLRAGSSGGSLRAPRTPTLLAALARPTSHTSRDRLHAAVPMR